MYISIKPIKKNWSEIKMENEQNISPTPEVEMEIDAETSVSSGGISKASGWIKSAAKTAFPFVKKVVEVVRDVVLFAAGTVVGVFSLFTRSGRDAFFRDLGSEDGPIATDNSKVASEKSTSQNTNVEHEQPVVLEKTVEQQPTPEQQPSVLDQPAHIIAEQPVITKEEKAESFSEVKVKEEKKQAAPVPLTKEQADAVKPWTPADVKDTIFEPDPPKKEDKKKDSEMPR